MIAGCALLVLLFLGASEAFHVRRLAAFPSLSRAQRARERSTHLMAQPQLGEVLMAEVESVGGYENNPQIFLKIQDSEDPSVSYAARMAANRLSEFERDSLTAGTTVKVRVAAIDLKGFVVGLLGKRPHYTPNYSAPREQQRNLSVIDGRRESGRETLSASHAPKERARDNHRTANANKAAEIAAPTQPPGPLLSNLRVGAKLTGTVVFSNAHKAFLDVSVYRRAQKGTFAPVQAVLNRVDVPQHLQPFWDKDVQRYRPNLMQKGGKAVVYVKEVYKNSGRLIVTSQPVDREMIVEAKRKEREAAHDRRVTRRLRRALLTLTAGDSLPCAVREVAPEGVLVSISVAELRKRQRERELLDEAEEIDIGDALEEEDEEDEEEDDYEGEEEQEREGEKRERGRERVARSPSLSLNISGLIPLSSLPPQFQFPAELDLSESMKRDLLVQDFAPQRELQCTVTKILPQATARDGFAVSLVFEKFLGEMPENEEEREALRREKMKDAAGETGTETETDTERGISEWAEEEDSDDYDDVDIDEDDEDDDFLLSADDEDDDEDTDDDGEGGEEDVLEVDEEIRAIYDELRGDAASLSVSRLLRWADIVEMRAHNALTHRDLEAALRAAEVQNWQRELSQAQAREAMEKRLSAKEMESAERDADAASETLTVEQFEEFVVNIQDAVEENEKRERKLTKKREREKGATPTHLSEKKESLSAHTATQAREQPSIESHTPTEGESVQSAMRAEYERLCGGAARLSLALLSQWEEVRALSLTERDIQQLLNLNDSKASEGIDFAQFEVFVDRVDALLRERETHSETHGETQETHTDTPSVPVSAELLLLPYSALREREPDGAVRVRSMVQHPLVRALVASGRLSEERLREIVRESLIEEDDDMYEDDDSYDSEGEGDDESESEGESEDDEEVEEADEEVDEEQPLSFSQFCTLMAETDRSVYFPEDMLSSGSDDEEEGEDYEEEEGSEGEEEEEEMSEEGEAGDFDDDGEEYEGEEEHEEEGEGVRSANEEVADALLDRGLHLFGVHEEVSEEVSGADEEVDEKVQALDALDEGETERTFPLAQLRECEEVRTLSRGLSGFEEVLCETEKEVRLENADQNKTEDVMTLAQFVAFYRRVSSLARHCTLPRESEDETAVIETSVVSDAHAPPKQEEKEKIAQPERKNDISTTIKPEAVEKKEDRKEEKKPVSSSEEKTTSTQTETESEEESEDESFSLIEEMYASLREKEKDGVVRVRTLLRECEEVRDLVQRDRMSAERLREIVRLCIVEEEREKASQVEAQTQAQTQIKKKGKKEKESAPVAVSVSDNTALSVSLLERVLLAVDEEVSLSLAEDDEEESLSDEELQRMQREAFDSLCASTDTQKEKRVRVRDLRVWEDLAELFSHSLLTQARFDELVRQVTHNKTAKDVNTLSLTFDQFCEFIGLVEESVEGASGDDVDDEAPTDTHTDTPTEKEPAKKRTHAETLWSLFLSLHSQRERHTHLQTDKPSRTHERTLRTEEFLNWKRVKDAVRKEVLPESLLHYLIKEVVHDDEAKTKKKGKNAKSEPLTMESAAALPLPVSLSFDHFLMLDRLLEDAERVHSVASQHTDTDEDTETETHSTLSDDDVLALTRQHFDELKSPISGRIPAKSLQDWAVIGDELRAFGFDVKESVSSALKSLSFSDGQELDFEDFQRFLDAIADMITPLADAQDDEEEDEVSEGENTLSPTQLDAQLASLSSSSAPVAQTKKSKPVSPTAGLGFGKTEKEIKIARQTARQKKALRKAGEEIYDVFDRLRGNNPAIPIDTLYEWRALQTLVETEKIKESKLDDAIDTALGAEGEVCDEVSLSQFADLLNLLRKSTKVDLLELDAQILREEEEGERAEKKPANSAEIVSRTLEEREGDEEEEEEVESGDDGEEEEEGEYDDEEGEEGEEEEEGEYDDEEGEEGEEDDYDEDESEDDEEEEEEEEASDDDDDDDDVDEADDSQFFDRGEAYSESESMRDSFKEICGKKETTATVAAVLAWEELAILEQWGAIKKDSVIEAFKAVGIPVNTPQTTRIDFAQFEKMLLALHEHIDYSKVNMDDESDEIDDGESIEEDFDSIIEKRNKRAATSSSPSFPSVKETRAAAQLSPSPTPSKTPEKKKGNGKKATSAEEELALLSKDLNDVLDDDEMDKHSEPMLESMFQELKNAKRQVTLDSLRNWGDLQYLARSGVLSEEDMEKMIQAVRVGKDGSVSFDQFKALMRRLNDLLIPAFSDPAKLEAMQIKPYTEEEKQALEDVDLESLLKQGQDMTKTFLEENKKFSGRGGGSSRGGPRRRR